MFLGSGFRRNDWSHPMTTRFVPPHPPRGPAPVPVWRGFFGERARNAVYGWSAPMFENWHIRRNILGIVVHVVTHPDAVQRVLQTKIGRASCRERVCQYV